ncbi:chloride channel protein [Clostridium butyricum]|uniref:Putative voltage gated chloride channel family n=1 Tax=Clostridium butyricum E4 str. BoNT E BL5262 TaxID=632245 RepID=C4IBL2_CLOBU|nr:chloride channel protein [Clostridium butyricum]EDT74032.1 putative voltage gated chloride channel family [Clostridium butyricum 5521]EEP56260.1 putative voltage gated chloride channel family [Clostridium butyricum E4 str. BoNT E BL5262]NFL31185.1 voltage-gated chloride channel [Clostridium butyricum]NFS18997.1 voltage-gated chloride channel [Clostridium butyricum]
MEETKNDYITIIKKIFKWVILSIIMAIPIGIVVGYYNIILTTANRYRKSHEYLIYFLPIAGLMITFMYLKSERNAYSGENLLKSEVQSAVKDIPFYMTFVVFLGSLATTFFGGSAGKEGSAVAMGGTLGDFLAGKFNLSNEDQRTLVLCGVGSAFGVIYDVPFAGAILGMELVLKGKFHYQALIPAFLTTVFSNEIAAAIGNTKVNYPILMLDDLSFMILIKLVLLGIIFGVGGSIFNLVLDNSSKIYGIITKNPYLKAILGGVLTIVLFWLVGDNYNGLGQTFIRDAFDKPATLMDSVWKIIFTAIALGSVFQGGRGNPTFFVGAALGSAVAKYIGFPLESCTALGMIGVFCGATSLPITSIAMSLEYFGGDEMVAIMIVMTISYIISGFYDILTKDKLPKEKSKIFSGGVS